MGSRYEREIEELLKRLEGKWRAPLSQRLVRRLRRSWGGVSRAWWKASLPQLVGGAVAFLFLAYIGRWVSPALARFVLLFAFFLFLWAFLVSWRWFNATPQGKRLKLQLREFLRRWMLPY